MKNRLMRGHSTLLRRYAALALAVLLAVQQCAAAVAYYGADGAGVPAFNDAVAVESVALKKGTDGDPSTYTDVKDGDSLSFNDTLYLLFNFEIEDAEPGGQIYKIDNSIKANNGKSAPYQIDIPTGLKIPDGANATTELVGKFTDEDGKPVELKFGDLVIENNTASVVFGADSASSLGSFWENNEFENIEDAYIYVNCQLDRDAIGGKEQYKILLTANTSVTVSISDNRKTPDTVEKKGEFDNDIYRFNWTVTYTKGGKDPADMLVDIFDENQVFVEDSVFINDVKAPSNWYNASGNQLIYKIGDSASLKPGDTIKLTYQTALTDKAVEPSPNPGNLTVTNEVYMLRGTTRLEALKTAQVTVPAASLTWLQKDGKQVGDREIEWTLTLRTLDRRLDNLVLYDCIPTGLTLKDNSFKINGATLTESTAKLDTSPSAIDSKQPTFTLSFNTPYASVYTITYHTVIKDDYFEEHSSEQKINFNNQAWLSFDWKSYNGSGTSVDFTFPTLDKGVGVDTNIIHKVSNGYNAATHTITWEVTVNPNKVYVLNGTVTDNLTVPGLTYVANSFSSANPVVTLDTAKSTNKNIVVNVVELKNTTVSYTFKTTVDNSADWAFNTNGKNYTNTATFKGEVQPAGGTASVVVERSASATQKITSEVLSKKFVSYDYSTNTITWNITVNQNKMPMTGVVLEDTLPVYLSYVDGSLPQGAAQVENRTLKITLPDNLVNGKEASLTYQTKLDVDACPDFKTDASVIISNSVTLTRDAYDPVETTVSHDISNQILNKTGMLKGDKIAYTVKINPNGMTLGGMSLTDKLPDGLQVDPESVKLYSATVGNDGTFTKGYEIVGWKLSLDGVKNSFTVALPAGNGRYMLEYDCDIVDAIKSPFSNHIAFDGDNIGGDAGQSSNSQSAGGGGGGGGGSASKKATLKITGTPGAVFVLYTEVKDEKVELERGTVNPDGTLSFSSKLKINKTYYVKQVEAPTGYELLDVEITVAPTGADEITTDLPNNKPIETVPPTTLPTPPPTGEPTTPPTPPSAPPTEQPTTPPSEEPTAPPSEPPSEEPTTPPTDRPDHSGGGSVTPSTPSPTPSPTAVPSPTPAPSATPAPQPNPAPTVTPGQDTVPDGGVPAGPADGNPAQPGDLPQTGDPLPSNGEDRRLIPLLAAASALLLALSALLLRAGRRGPRGEA
ncbi:hypothetical protein CE91St41_17000 [Oscillospiraceae bacterium]|nr:hypothetical protein CE91St40_20540 [Oscillospiraceae bacterium]BDF74811.1 hypothetical protein CE91St41_17000 [Oscillospiraceae bacterium]